MIEHWYEYLPAAWATPEGRWYISICVVLIVTASFVAGYVLGRMRNSEKE